MPTNGQIGLVRFNFKLPTQTQIDLAHTDRVSIGQYPFQQDGPDLAFLRLPTHVVRSLEANSIFYNLTLRRDAVLSSRLLGNDA
jgi:hypothetical protein